MGDEDFELIRRAWDAASRRDEAGFRADLHPEVEAVPFGAALEGKRYRGPDECWAWLRDDILGNWEFFEVIPEDFRRVGDKILVTGRWHARGKESGVELDIAATWVVEVRDGKVAYWQTYTDRSQALRDADVDG